MHVRCVCVCVEMACIHSHDRLWCHCVAQDEETLCQQATETVTDTTTRRLPPNNDAEHMGTARRQGHITELYPVSEVSEVSKVSEVSEVCPFT